MWEESEYDKLGRNVKQKKIPIYGDPATGSVFLNLID
jgi:hypothetical protein